MREPVGEITQRRLTRYAEGIAYVLKREPKAWELYKQYLNSIPERDAKRLNVELIFAMNPVSSLNIEKEVIKDNVIYLTKEIK